jgi:2-amino-4-hydroxy-6-hydroxymethyldihydropteridine diphosphokinase
MILIALGSNINGPWGSPRETLARAITELNRGPVRIARVSSLIVTAPFGRKNQPDFANAVASVETHLSPISLLARLHVIERNAGRKRGLRWGPRTLDLDILDYHGLIFTGRGIGKASLTLPHAGIADRSFVLAPIAEIAPRWRHPRTHQSAKAMLARLNQN